MSQSKGVIRVGRKGIAQFAFGEEDTPGSEPFTVDVVNAFEEWLGIDERLREGVEPDAEGGRAIPKAELPTFREAQVVFVEKIRGKTLRQVVQRDAGLPEDPVEPITAAEAADFIARLSEQYQSLAAFFLVKSPQERDEPSTSGSPTQLQFSEEPAA